MFYNLKARNLSSLDTCYRIHTSGEIPLVYAVHSGYF